MLSGRRRCGPCSEYRRRAPPGARPRSEAAPAPSPGPVANAAASALLLRLRLLLRLWRLLAARSRLDRDRRAVGIEFLDLGRAAQRAQIGRQQLARQQLFDLWTRLFERRRRLLALVDHFDDVPAELRLHGHLRVFALFHCEYRLRELRHHLGSREITEVAAVLLGRRIGRLLLGYCGEI